VRTALALSVLSMTLLVAACGSKHKTATTTTTPAKAAPAVQQAVSKTISAGGEHATISATVKASGQTVGVSGSGDFSSQTHRGKLTIQLALGGIQTTADEVLDGTTVYLTSPLFQTVLPAGKKWLKLDLQSAGKTFGVDASALTSQDPTAALEQLKALKDVREVGTSSLTGTTLTHYRGTIDVSKLPAATQTALTASGASFGAVDVWVGGDGYVHKVRVVNNAKTNGGTASTTLATTLSDFGKKVDVSVPSDAETVDASKLAIPGLTG
jgi:hypothetical protein